MLRTNSTRLDRREEEEGALDMERREAVEEVVRLRAQVHGGEVEGRSGERRGKETGTNNLLRKNN
jgi:hypothetical protein